MQAWQEQPERTNLFWLSALSWSARTLGRGFLRVLCVPIAGFFVLTAGQPRRVSREFLNRVLDRPAGLWDVFLHFYTFALVSGDRLLFLAGRMDKFDLQMQGDDLVRQHSARGRGCIFLVSHLGSFDAMRVPAVESEAMPVRILIDKQHNPAAIAVIERLNPQLAAGAIDAAVGPVQLALTLGEACSDGEMVGIMADRAAPGEALQAVQFLGETAHLPRGPWVLALALKVPVILCFAAYSGGNQYAVRFTQVYDGAPIARRERRALLETLISTYAAELEQMARQHPYNWFNFYDFWSNEPTGDH